MSKITYMCPVCCKFADKEAGYYDHRGAVSCVSKCPDCKPSFDDPTRWYDANGSEIRQSEIVMPVWPTEPAQ